MIYSSDKLDLQILYQFSQIDSKSKKSINLVDLCFYMNKCHRNFVDFCILYYIVANDKNFAHWIWSIYLDFSGIQILKKMQFWDLVTYNNLQFWLLWSQRKIIKINKISLINSLRVDLYFTVVSKLKTTNDIFLIFMVPIRISGLFVNLEDISYTCP